MARPRRPTSNTPHDCPSCPRPMAESLGTSSSWRLRERASAPAPGAREQPPVPAACARCPPPAHPCLHPLPDSTLCARSGVSRNKVSSDCSRSNRATSSRIRLISKLHLKERSSEAGSASLARRQAVDTRNMTGKRQFGASVLRRVSTNPVSSWVLHACSTSERP